MVALERRDIDRAGGALTVARTLSGGEVVELGRRGWRLDSPARGENVDGIVALAMAVERASQRQEPARLLGWL